MTISNTKGFWEVNGKRAKELNLIEQKFMNEFFKSVKPSPNQQIEVEVKNFQQLNIQS